MKDFISKNKMSLFIGFILIFVLVFNFLNQDENIQKQVHYKEFMEQVEEGKVAIVMFNHKNPNLHYILKEDQEKYLKEDVQKQTYVEQLKKLPIKTQKEIVIKTQNPEKDDFKEVLLLHDVHIEHAATLQELSTFSLISSLGSLFIVIVLLVVLLKYSGIGFSSNHKKHETNNHITFDSIAGNEEAKNELREIVKFIKNKKRYEKIGVEIPSGAIFYGEPGTGKTLLAKAIASEANVNFFYSSGSDFVEMYVGKGAKAVRDLFKQAKKESPSIVFIDEIDSIGGNRNMHSNTEDLRTLNALLAEIDGFNSDENVFVIAATNRLDTLDPALTRPGRFEKHISFELPKEKDRLAILNLYAKNLKLQDVSLEDLAKTTIGFSGASLEALIKEAMRIAVINDREYITPEDIEESFFKAVTKSNMTKDLSYRNSSDLNIVAWHEAGHALIAKTHTTDSVPKVSIIPSTNGMGGVTFTTPIKEGLHSKSYLRGKIKTLYAGRIAEYLYFGNDDEITTGASQDIKQASQIIKHYISTYGMSEAFGMFSVDVIDSENELLEEAIKLSNELYEETKNYMTEHKELLEHIAELLLEKEIIVEEELDTLISNYQEKNNTTLKK